MEKEKVLDVIKKYDEARKNMYKIFNFVKDLTL